MDNKNQNSDAPVGKETNQQNLENQNDQHQNHEEDFDKKGSNERNEELTESKNEEKKKDLYEEENKGIDKQPTGDDVEDMDIDESTGGSNFKQYKQLQINGVELINECKY